MGVVKPNNNMEYTTEAEALADIEECREDYDDIVDSGSYERFLKERGYSIKEDYRHYQKNKKAKVGDKIRCAQNKCSNCFVKKSYQQAFCGTKCRTKFWNRQRLND